MRASLFRREQYVASNFHSKVVCVGPRRAVLASEAHEQLTAIVDGLETPGGMRGGCSGLYRKEVSESSNGNICLL